MTNDAKIVGEIGPFLVCPSCSHALPFEPGSLDSYFLGAGSACSHCMNEFDPWRVTLGSLGGPFRVFGALSLAGARRTILDTTLAAQEYKEIDLTQFGVPQSAEVIDLNLTSMGSALPLLAHGNAPLLDPFPPRLHLLGRAFPGELAGGRLSVSVTWFIRDAEDTMVRHLIDAARHHRARRFDALIPPANTAAEAAITPAIESVLSSFSGRKQVKGMLENGATYGHQLNVLLAIAARLVGAPEFPEHIRGVLNRLRQHRNDLLHTGSCDTQTEDMASEHLAAALFGVDYARLLRSKIEPSRHDLRGT